MRNKILYKFLFLIIVLQFCTTLFAQTDFTLQHYTQKNGLPQNSANQLFFDKQQYLWIATEAGIVRFDGINFFIFNNSNTPIIENERFRWILPTSDKEVLTSNADGKLFKILNNKIHEINLKNESYNLPYISGGIPSKKQLLYFKNEGYSKTKNWRDFPYKIIPDTANSFYVLGNLFIYKYKNTDLVDSINIGNIRDVNSFFKIGNYLYISDKKNNIYYIDVLKKSVAICKFKNFENTNKSSVKIIYKTQKNYTYLINSNKVFELVNFELLNPSLLDLKLIIKQIPTHIEISDIEYNDSLKILAIGSQRDGLFIYKPKQFNNLYLKNSNKDLSTVFYAIAAKNDSTVFSSSQFEFINNKVFHDKISKNLINFESVYIENYKRIYFAFVDSLFVYDIKTKKTKFIKTFGKFISCINGSNDSIWVGTLNNISLLINQKIQISLSVDKRLQTIYINPEKKIYFSNCDGLFEVIINNSTFSYKNLIPNVCIRDIYSHNNLLFATSYSSGLYVLTNHKTYKLPPDKNNYLSKCHSIQIDSQQRVWISTNNGIFETSLNQINDYIKDNSLKISYHYFDEQNGIENSEFNGGCYPASVQLKKGNIYFPSMSGLVNFNSNNFTKRISQKKIFIDKIIVDNNSIDVSNNIVLDCNIEDINVYFSSPYWFNSYEVSYQYQLVGFNSKPILIRDSKLPINFTNLNSGNYTLIIKKFGGSSDENAETIINIKILKKYYQTWWFITLVTITIILLIIAIVIFYNKLLLKQNIVLERKVNQRTAELALINDTLQNTNSQLLASDQRNIRSINLKQKLIAILTHDIITPLKFISMVARNSSKINNQNEFVNVLKDIDHTSKKLYDNAQNILNWIKYQSSLIKVEKSNVALFAVIDDLNELFKDILESKHNDITNNIDPDQIVFTDKNILAIVIQNIISNAVKYNSKTQIEIKSIVNDGFYIIEIKDNGCGINQANLDRIKEIKNRQNAYAIKDNSETSGLGFIIITELLNILNGYFEIDSSNLGTTVTVFIPI